MRKITIELCIPDDYFDPTETDETVKEDFEKDPGYLLTEYRTITVEDTKNTSFKVTVESVEEK